jgi:hypothetical protein
LRSLPWQRLDGGTHAVAGFALLVRDRRRFRLRRHERGRQRRLVHVLTGGERRSGLDGVDAHDSAAQSLLVGADARGQVGERRFVSQLAAERLAGCVELAPLTADASRPRIASERVDHRPADAAFGKGLELDSARFVEAVCGINQTQHAVLHQIPDINRVRHRRRHPSGEGFHEGETRDDPAILTG